MKKDLGFFVSLIFLFLLSGGVSQADDIILPDFRFNLDKRYEKISENADRVTFQTVRNNHSFDRYFDKLIVEIYKRNPEKSMTPSYFGEKFIAREILGDFRSEKYVIKDSDGEYFGVFCSHRAEKCEIIRVIRGCDGLINMRYVHNNLWHFQNNTGSFIEVVRRISVYPEEFLIKQIYGEGNFVRL